MRIFKQLAVSAMGVAGAVALMAGPAFAHECTNASKPDGAGAQFVEGPEGLVSAKVGLLKRLEKGLIDGGTGGGFHGIIAWDEDGDGVADGHTYIVGPGGEIPLTAQLRGSPDHGIVNLCGPAGCPSE